MYGEGEFGVIDGIIAVIPLILPAPFFIAPKGSQG
jgi:hypothetical protein